MAGGGGALLMRHALLRRLEQAAARHREVAGAGLVAAASWAQQQRQACSCSSSSSSSSPAAAPAPAAGPADHHPQHQRQHHHHPYHLAISAASSSGGAPSIWRASATAPPTPLSSPSPTLVQGRNLSLLAGLANLVNPSTNDKPSTSSSPASRRAYRERRLVGYAPEQLFGVVADVARYSEFVPWCRRSVVLRRSPDGKEMEAELEVGFQALSERYVSRVKLQRPQGEVEAGSVDGATATAATTPTTPQQQPTPPLAVVEATTSRSVLFEHLASTWTLRPGPQPGTTWLAFAVEFGFASPAHRHVADLFFDQVVRRMVAAFEGRCAALYGASALDRRRMEGDEGVRE